MIDSSIDIRPIFPQFAEIEFISHNFFYIVIYNKITIDLKFMKYEYKLSF